MASNTMIPLKDFFKNPEMSSFSLSPDGKHISYMKPWKDGNRMMNVYVRPIDSDKEVRITDASKRSLYGYFWLNNNRIAYIQDKGGDENIHIYAVDIDGSNNIDLTPLGIINKFDLFNIKLTDTTNYGHFGRNNLPWEAIDLKDEIKSL